MLCTICTNTAKIYGPHTFTPLLHILLLYMRAVQKVSVHFEYLENRSGDLDVTWQPVSGDLTAYL